MINDTNCLSELKAELMAGMSMSKQGSYERRLPAAEALPKIRNALKGLRTLVVTHASPDAWRTLALAEEALLHYPAAVTALESAIALSPQADRKDLKRLAQLRENAAKWNALGLNASAVRELASYLELTLNAVPCDHSHRHTAAWLVSKGVKAPVKSINGLKTAGGFCDCEVLVNVV